MTRINVGIDPKELPDKLLLAEHREITRIPNAIASGRFNLDGVPRRFTLGTGHVKFFYLKIAYLLSRYNMLYRECIRRGFNVTPKHNAFSPDRIPLDHFGQYTPTYNDRKLIRSRIESKGFILLTVESNKAK